MIHQKSTRRARGRRQSAGGRLALPLLLPLILIGAGSPEAGRRKPARPRAVGAPAPAASDAYDWPLQPPRPVTSSFGEYRRNHFHGGIDFSTDGRTGLPVHAVADGWVWRVRASGSGYGRSIYLRLTDGRTAVYAHLDRFAPVVRDFVEAAQESLGQYEVDLQPGPGRLSFRRGEIVAWSGDSGAGPAHLHFEMREGMKADLGLNPRWIGFSDPDSTRPLIRRLIVAPVGPGSRVDGQPGRASYDVIEGGAGRFRLARPPKIEGAARLSIETWDPAPRGNRLAISRVRLTWGGRRLFEASLERFSWERAHDAERFYDQAEADMGKSFVVHLYRPDGPASPLPGLGPAGQGLIDPRREGASGESLEVAVEDAAGHVSRLTWRLVLTGGPRTGADSDTLTLVGDEGTTRGPSLGLETRVTPDGAILTAPAAGDAEADAEVLTIPDYRMPGPPRWWEQWLGGGTPRTAPALRLRPSADGAPATLIGPPGRFVVRPSALTRRARPGRPAEFFLDTLAVIGIVRGPETKLQLGALTMSFPESAAFGPAWIGVSAAPAEPLVGMEPVSGVARLAAPGLVFDRPVRLALAAPADADTMHVGLYVRDAGGDWNWVGAIRGDDGIGGETRYPGDLGLYRDTRPPRIVIDTPSTGRLTTDDRPLLRATLTDTGSGIGWRQIEATLDGLPQIVVWDPESASLTGRSRHRLAAGVHTLVVRARDRAGNWSEARGLFRVAGR